MKLFVGIDLAKASHCICIMDENGKKIKQLKIKNDQKGFDILYEILKNNEVLIGLEKGHGFIIEFLKNKNMKLYSINPRIIKRFKETYWVSGSKDDWRDSEAIANYLRMYHERLRPLLSDSKEVELIRDYCEVYNRMTESQVQLTNRLIYVLENYFPLYLSLFSNNTVEILLKMILRFPKWNELINVSKKEFSEFLKDNFYRNPIYIDRIFEKIKNYKQVVSEETDKALSFEACYLAESLLKLSEKLKMLVSEMENILSDHKLGGIFSSIPGAGTVIASHLLAIFGDNYERFKHYNEAQSYFGTAPYLYQSGNYCKVMMRRACNKMGRRTFYQLAFCCLTKCLWAKKYYSELRKRGKKNAAALRTLSNKWVRIVFSMWKNNKQYDPQRFEIAEQIELSKIA
jgi:transposase